MDASTTRMVAMKSHIRPSRRRRLSMLFSIIALPLPLEFKDVILVISQPLYERRQFAHKLTCRQSGVGVAHGGQLIEKVPRRHIGEHILSVLRRHVVDQGSHGKFV